MRVLFMGRWLGLRETEALAEEMTSGQIQAAVSEPEKGVCQNLGCGRQYSARTSCPYCGCTMQEAIQKAAAENKGTELRPTDGPSDWETL